MDKFFAVFGKIAIVAIFLGGIAYGGYYFGKSGTINLGIEVPTAVSTTNPEPEITGTIESTATPTPSIAGTPAAGKTKMVSAGVAAGSGLSFSMYTVETPDGWASVHEFDKGVPTDTLTITKGAYQIKIYQAAAGGAQCVYPGDPNADQPFTSSYDTYTEVTANGTTLRRSNSGGPLNGKMTYTICQKNNSGIYGAPTSYGHMSITAPATPDDVILKEIDGILASLKKS
jgi:hypothetical protein